MYKNRAIKVYLNDLAARLPAPGGGSACALNAAMAAALLSMVINFTLGKPKYAQYEKELKDILRKSESLRVEFLNLVDLDVIAYKSKNLRDALNIPFMVARLSFEGIKLCPALVKKGNLNLISDVAVAAILFEASLASARFNVDINLKSLGDKKLARVIGGELNRKQKQAEKIRVNTERRVGEIIRG
ncbi:MAG TPA: cyclodeaminase/cyclohydrolase family protein [Candidatus Omnitrophota bacterium]|nr:cyclodeaminase/cyclohydrolase family protein [Candidatus Omnitrophota bacterium]